MAATITSLDEETSKKVLRQVEFYFSDSNLPRDRFLKQTISDSEHGLVSLALICAFSRMRSHLGVGEAKPDDVSDYMIGSVADTLRKSNFLKVSEDGKNRFSIVKMWNLPPLNLPSVRMRTHFSTTIKRVFCGTALIEYSSEEDAQKILEQSLIFDGAELEYLVKDFDEERKKHGQVVDNTQSGPGCKSSDEADFPKGLAVAFTLKRKQFRLKEISSHNSVKLEADTSKTDGGECEEIVCQGSNKVAEVDEKVDEVIEDDAKQKINSKSGCETDEKEAKDDKKSSQVGDNKDEVEVAIKGKSGYIGFEIPEASQKARAVALLSEQGGLIVKNFIACLEPVTAFRH